MGRMHYAHWHAQDGVEVAAICHTDPDRLKSATGTSGNTEAAGAAIEFDTIQLYSDFDEMLAEGNLDAVSITLPTDLHAAFSIKALEAGLHVLCEKPMALNVAQCDDMIAAAQRTGKILLIGHCIRFWPEYARAKEIVDCGEYGTVVAVTFRRLGSIPAWSRSNWFTDEARSGGMVLDLHIHDTDYAQYLFGMPRAVRTFGARSLGLGLTHVVTQYLYGDDRLITAEGSWQMMPSFGFEMSFDIVLEKATLVYDNTREPPFRVCPLVGEAFTPEVEEGDGYSHEIAHFAKAIRGEKGKEVTTLEQSRNSVRIVEAEKESARTGKRVDLE
jgi:predicted dehydrogenase